MIMTEDIIKYINRNMKIWKKFFFAEDPGAANYLSTLYTLLNDFVIHFFATNTAYDFLIQQGYNIKKYEKDKIKI